MIRVSQLRLPWLLLLAALASGCLSDRTVTAPDSSGGDGSLAVRSESASDARSSANGNLQYPLTVGNHWRYRSHEYSDWRFVGYPVHVIEDLHLTTTLDLFCEEVVGDTRYVYERFTFILSNGSSNGTSRYSQNEHGLWREFGLQPPAACGDALTGAPASDVSVRAIAQQQVDAAIARNPQRAEIRAAWNRIQAQREAIRRDRPLHLLAYPLHPGRTWRYGNYGGRMTVEALETLHLPGGDVRAWRIRYEYPHQDPRSHTHYWFSDIGMVQFVSHIEDRLVYDDGRIEVLTNESSEHLESFQIAESRSAR